MSADILHFKHFISTLLASLALHKSCSSVSTEADANISGVWPVVGLICGDVSVTTSAEEDREGPVLVCPEYVIPVTEYLPPPEVPTPILVDEFDCCDGLHDSNTDSTITSRQIPSINRKLEDEANSANSRTTFRVPILLLDSLSSVNKTWNLRADFNPRSPVQAELIVSSDNVLNELKSLLVHRLADSMNEFTNASLPKVRTVQLNFDFKCLNPTSQMSALESRLNAG